MTVHDSKLNNQISGFGTSNLLIFGHNGANIVSFHHIVPKHHEHQMMCFDV